MRIGIEPERLLRGDQLRHTANIGRLWWRDRCRIGLKNGAHPNDWLGHVGEVPLDDSMVIERMNDTYEWEAVVS